VEQAGLPPPTPSPLRSPTLPGNTSLIQTTMPPKHAQFQHRALRVAVMVMMPASQASAPKRNRLGVNERPGRLSPRTEAETSRPAGCTPIAKRQRLGVKNAPAGCAPGRPQPPRLRPHTEAQPPRGEGRPGRLRPRSDPRTPQASVAKRGSQGGAADRAGAGEALLPWHECGRPARPGPGKLCCRARGVQPTGPEPGKACCRARGAADRAEAGFRRKFAQLTQR
jgi:hypothetical protein